MSRFDDIFNWDLDKPEPELKQGNPTKCPGGFEQNEDNNFENLMCENCDYYLACFPEHNNCS